MHTGTYLQIVLGNKCSENRRYWPTSLDTFRVVPYDSSRGLEGWITVCIDFGSFFDYKMSIKEEKKIESTILDEAPIASFAANSVNPHYFAARWSLIPFTRGVGVLVIQEYNLNEPVKQWLQELEHELPETVERIRT